MPRSSDISILNRGESIWNKWRQKSPEIQPNLRRAILAWKDFKNFNLRGVNFEGAHLRYCSFDMTQLSGANLRGADLTRSYFLLTDLSRSDLRHSSLNLTTFAYCDFTQTLLTGAVMGSTIFAGTDLSTAQGLETITHGHPSTIGFDTLSRSGTNTPEAFLRGCGVPETFITYARSLVANPIEYYSCFISHSSKDKVFADRLHADLQAENIRCWYAPEDLKIGDKFRTTIEESIRIYDKIMIVLSENSIQSAWVEDEVEAGLERERRSSGSLVLFPIRLDNTVMETEQAWAASLRRTRHIGDFSNWKDHDSYQAAFARLLRDLKSQTKAITTP